MKKPSARFGSSASGVDSAIVVTSMRLMTRTWGWDQSQAPCVSSLLVLAEGAEADAYKSQGLSGWGSGEGANR